jgi:hypothetical protein
MRPRNIRIHPDPDPDPQSDFFSARVVQRFKKLEENIYLM